MRTIRSSTASFVQIALENCGKTQREVAREAGLNTPNLLSMFKAGETKVPISRIPALARALGVDPFAFTDIAMREYHPELWKLLKDQYHPTMTDEQRLLVETVSDVLGERSLEWSPAFEAALEGLIELAVQPET